MTDFQLNGKVALVTGAGKGIGAACAEKLADQGADVIAVARTLDDLESLRGDIKCWSMDVTTDEFFDRVAEMACLDILVNNAGTNQPEPIEAVTAETLDRLLNLNVRTAFLTAQAATKVMKSGSGGSIINMSSQMGHVGAPNRSVYCMTKHALEGLTRAMAVELGPHRIRVNSVAPTFIETPLTRPFFEDQEFSNYVLNMIPLGKLGELEDVVNAVLYLASPLAKMTTGHSLSVDGGWTAH